MCECVHVSFRLALLLLVFLLGFRQFCDSFLKVTQQNNQIIGRGHGVRGCFECVCEMPFVRERFTRKTHKYFLCLDNENC